MRNSWNGGSRAGGTDFGSGAGGSLTAAAVLDTERGAVSLPCETKRDDLRQRKVAVAAVRLREHLSNHLYDGWGGASRSVDVSERIAVTPVAPLSATVGSRIGG